MKELLRNKLWNYIIENNPDLMFDLQERYIVQNYLDAKVAAVSALWEGMLLAGQPSYIVEEHCMNELTQELRPSKYHYVRRILEEDFQHEFNLLREQGTLTFELCNLIEECQHIFDHFGLNEENEDHSGMRYAVMGQVSGYLAHSVGGQG